VAVVAVVVAVVIAVVVVIVVVVVVTSAGVVDELKPVARGALVVVVESEPTVVAVLAGSSDREAGTPVVVVWFVVGGVDVVGEAGPVSMASVGPEPAVAPTTTPPTRRPRQMIPMPRRNRRPDDVPVGSAPGCIADLRQ
jgi:hypothetical protein